MGMITIVENSTFLGFFCIKSCAANRSVFVFMWIYVLTVVWYFLHVVQQVNRFILLC